MVIPDIVEIKRLCSSGQWKAYAEGGKIFLHDTVAGETVCIGTVDNAHANERQWLYSSINNPKYRICPNCGTSFPVDADGKRMDEEKLLALKFAYQILTDSRNSERYCFSAIKNSEVRVEYYTMLELLNEIAKGLNCGGKPT